MWSSVSCIFQSTKPMCKRHYKINMNIKLSKPIPPKTTKQPQLKTNSSEPRLRFQWRRQDQPLRKPWWWAGSGRAMHSLSVNSPWKNNSRLGKMGRNTFFIQFGNRNEKKKKSLLHQSWRGQENNFCHSPQGVAQKTWHARGSTSSSGQLILQRARELSSHSCRVKVEGVKQEIHDQRVETVH